MTREMIIAFSVLVMLIAFMVWTVKFSAHEMTREEEQEMERLEKELFGGRLKKKASESIDWPIDK